MCPCIYEIIKAYLKKVDEKEKYVGRWSNFIKSMLVADTPLITSSTFISDNI